MGLVQTVARRRAQIRTSPPLLAMSCSCVPVGPALSADPFSIEGFHPLPIDIGEVSKLCQIEQTNVAGHFECVRETRRETLLLGGAANTKAAARAALGVTPAAGVQSVVTTSLYELGLKRPLFELLRPAVVVRRRPERMQFLS